MRLVRQILIAAPPERVWALLDDESNIQKWMPYVIDTHFPDGKPESDPVGAKFLQIMEQDGKRSAYAGIITGYEKGRMIGMRMTPEAFTVDVRYFVQPHGDGASTELTYDSQTHAATWWGSIMLMAGKTLLARIADQQLARLREFAEHGSIAADRLRR